MVLRLSGGGSCSQPHVGEEGGAAGAGGVGEVERVEWCVDGGFEGEDVRFAACCGAWWCGDEGDVAGAEGGCDGGCALAGGAFGVRFESGVAAVVDEEVGVAGVAGGAPDQE